MPLKDIEHIEQFRENWAWLVRFYPVKACNKAANSVTEMLCCVAGSGSYYGNVGCETVLST